MANESAQTADDLAARLAEACSSLSAAWLAAAQQLGAGPRDGSPMVEDRVAVDSIVRDEPIAIGLLSGHLAAQYTDAMSMHLRALAALFATGQIYLAPWSLARAAVELAGRVSWVIDPGPKGGSVDGTRRLARAVMEVVASARFAEYAATRSNQSRPHLRLLRDRRRAHSELCMRLFPKAQIRWQGPESPKRWKVAGERYLGLRAGVELLGRTHLGNAAGIYDALSEYAHPSVEALGHQTQWRTSDDGATRQLTYTPEPWMLKWQAKVVCSAFIAAARLVCAYQGVTQDALTEWEDNTESLLPDWFETLDE